MELYKFKKKTTKYSKGYRLKAETHNIIYRLQDAVKADQDAVIAAACKMYYNMIISGSMGQNEMASAYKQAE
jgi:hypothetical protein